MLPNYRDVSLRSACPIFRAGKDIPIGAVVMTEERVASPQLVDSDIGCGMSFKETCLHVSVGGKLSVNKLQSMANHLESIDGPFASTQELMELCAHPMQWVTRLVDPMPVLSNEKHYSNLGTNSWRRKPFCRTTRV
jgi:hypothetical protein